jgi:hypothetical protein
VQQGGIRDKADNHPTANKDMSWVKQVLKKCLTYRPQSELKMRISLLTFSQHVITIAAPLRRDASKLNRPEASVNLTILERKKM